MPPPPFLVGRRRPLYGYSRGFLPTSAPHENRVDRGWSFLEHPVGLGGPGVDGVPEAPTRSFGWCTPSESPSTFTGRDPRDAWIGPPTRSLSFTGGRSQRLRGIVGGRVACPLTSGGLCVGLMLLPLYVVLVVSGSASSTRKPSSTSTVYLGEVVGVTVDEEVLMNGSLDWSKVASMLFTFSDKSYWKLGDRVAEAWSVGKGFSA